MKIRLFPARVASWAASALAILPCAYAAQPWDEPFAKDTRAIAQAARQITRADNPGAIVLLDDYRYVVHADGRTDLTHRKVFRVTQQDAVEEWSSAEERYQPWYQKKPEIRARVIGPDGEVHLLDSKTVADAPTGDSDATIYSDARVVRAPLPSVAANSVVEYEIAVQETAPLLAEGVARRIGVETFVPLERFHLVVDAEAGVNLRFVTKLMPDNAVQRSDTGKGTHLECTFGPSDPSKHFEGNLPSDVPSYPYLAFSTGKSWQGIATRYAAIIDQKLQSTDWRSFLEGVDLKGEPRAVAARLAAKLHAGVRYTGVEFGEATIVPGVPAETIKRGYGDCKDKSTLLVAMLRAAGLKADVALLLSGWGTDVDPELPGIGVFDHVIVRVASDPPLWIDATAAETRVGFLPAADQGRLALIASPNTTGLVKVPESTSADDRYRDSFEVKMSEFGNGSIREIFEADGGTRESTSRASFGQDDSKLKERMDTYAKQSLAAKSAGKYEVSRRDDFGGPFRLDVEATECRFSSTGLDDAGVATTPWGLFADVPYTLKMAKQADDKDDQKRRHDFVFPEPYRSEIRYTIIPPTLFKVANVPESQEVKIGTGTYSRSYKTNPDGSFEAVYRFDSGKRRLTPEEFEAYRADLLKYDSKTPELITFYPETAEYIALGQSGKALAVVRSAVEANPESAMAHVRLSHILLTAHLGGPALAEAKKATELDPKSSTAWQTLAAAYESDNFGRSMQGNWDRGEAEKALLKAVELDKDDQVAKMNLAILLEYNAHGWRYAKDSRLDEAIALYREMLKDPQSGQPVRENLVVALLRAGKLDDAKSEAKKDDGPLAASILSMITAMQEGPARAIVNSQSAYADPAQRARFLTSVALSLVQERRYSDAGAMLNAAARLANIPGVTEQADLLSKIKRWDDVLLPEDDPRWPVQRMMLEIMRGNLSREALQPLVASGTDFSSLDQDIADIQSGLAVTHRQYSGLGLPAEALADITLSMTELGKDGDDAHGYRIGGNVRVAFGMPAMYVVREDGRYKVIGAGLDGLDRVGTLVLDLLAKKDLAGAQWWLDKVAQDAQERSDFTGPPVIKSLWSGVTPESRGADAVRLAAQVLIATGTGKADAIQKLQQARLRATNAMDRSLIDKAVCESLVKARNWDGLLTAAKQLQTSPLFVDEAFRYYLMAAKGARKWVELAAEAKKRYDAKPQNEAAVQAMVLAAAGQGNWASAAEWAKKVDKNGIYQIEQAETEAWTAMVAGRVTDETLTALHKVKENAGKRADYQYTEALLEAILHKPEDALDSLIRSIGDEDYSRLHPVAWVAYARICEQYGYPGESEKALTMARSTAHREDDLTDWVKALLDGRPADKH